jgi:putative ABC transport system substrate-binding protein
MRRRDFITLLGGAAATWPLAARGQQMRRMGALIGSAESDPDRQTWIGEFRSTLSKLGWMEGGNIRTDWRWAAADRDRATAYAHELVGLNPDVLFVDNTFVAQALKKAALALPIVFAHVTDPITSGFVVSLAHPGGNMTGFTDSESESHTKLVEIIKQIAPQTSRIATLGGPTQSAGEKVRDAIDSAASSVGLRNTLIEVGNAGEIEAAIADFGREPNGALLVPGDPVTTSHLQLILMLAARYQLPVVGGYRYLATNGGLASYGANVIEQYRGAAGYIDRILKGAKPAELPVQQPTKYELKINLRAAKALGLDVRLSLQQLADEVIE